MLDIPQRFNLETDSKFLNLIPLVVVDNRLYFSTSKESLEEGLRFKPLIKNMGSIKESIDIQNKTFKISSVTLSLFINMMMSIFLIQYFLHQ